MAAFSSGLIDVGSPSYPWAGRTELSKKEGQVSHKQTNDPLPHDLCFSSCLGFPQRQTITCKLKTKFPPKPLSPELFLVCVLWRLRRVKEGRKRRGEGGGGGRGDHDSWPPKALPCWKRTGFDCLLSSLCFCCLLLLIQKNPVRVSWLKGGQCEASSWLALTPCVAELERDPVWLMGFLFPLPHGAGGYYSFLTTLHKLESCGERGPRLKRSPVRLSLCTSLWAFFLIDDTYGKPSPLWAGGHGCVRKQAG